MSIVLVDRVDRSYGSNLVLDGVSFELDVGVTALLGPNGAGKTTLLRCVATVLRADSGKIVVNGFDVGRPGELVSARGSLGYMPQELGFYPGFTVRRFLDHVAVLKGIGGVGVRRRAVEAAIGAVGLGDRADERIRKLSGGMRRRLGLAVAVVGSPPVLILDEPTVGLDPEQRMRFRELIGMASVDGSAVLLSTHQTEDVAALCERVLVIDGGRLVFDGSPGGLTEVARGRVWLSDYRPDGGLVSWKTGSGRWRSIGDPPESARLLEPTLEDGYLALVGRPPDGEAGP